MKYGFGVDLGGTTVKIACFTEQGEMVTKWEIPTDTNNAGENILPDIAKSVKQYIEDKKLQDVLGIGIGVPGPVDPRGIIDRGINLGWGRKDVAGELSAITGYPVSAGNDATLAALGEAWMGAGKGYESMILITLGTGIGGGIVVDGKILPGAHGAGGEIGHMTLNREETVPCNCGKYGCAEQYCSATGIVRMTKEALQKSDTPSCLRQQELTCKAVFDAAAAGDTLACEVLEKVYTLLGEFIADICCVVDPEVVCLGGGVSKAGNVLLEGVRKHFVSRVFPCAAETVFTIATLGNDAGVYGAFRLAMMNP